MTFERGKQGPGTARQGRARGETAKPEAGSECDIALWLWGGGTTLGTEEEKEEEEGRAQENGERRVGR